MRKSSEPLMLPLKVIIQVPITLFHLKVKGKTQLDLTLVSLLLIQPHDQLTSSFGNLENIIFKTFYL